MKRAFLVNIDLVRRIVIDVPENKELTAGELTDLIIKEIGDNCNQYAKEWATDLAEGVGEIRDDVEVSYGTIEEE